jgi:2-polyprenyl-3-methyl-5-hydroxy-6-metoxy-1,4-benzoquinol methylase
MKNTKEEWDKVDPYNVEDDKWWVKLEHLGRYLFAADYLAQFQPKVIADIAAGVGYGIPELTRAAGSIVAVDSSQEMLKLASAKYGGGNVTFVQQDIDQGTMVSEIGASLVDAIVSFETLEHLLNPSGAVEQFSQLLRSGGHLICSVPNVIFEPLWPHQWGAAGLPANKCHTQLFNFNSFSRLLNQHDFAISYRVGQSWTNILYRRESELVQKEALKLKTGDRRELHTPEMIRMFANLLGYPTAEDVDGSYSIIVVAQKMTG